MCFNRGDVFDVVVDVRKDSPTFANWCSFYLSAFLGNSILIPEGCAHGFQVLEDNSQLLYVHSEKWYPNSDTGIRFNDPRLAIDWPLEPKFLSKRDLSFPEISNL